VSPASHSSEHGVTPPLSLNSSNSTGSAQQDGSIDDLNCLHAGVPSLTASGTGVSQHSWSPLFVDTPEVTEEITSEMLPDVLDYKPLSLGCTDSFRELAVINKEDHCSLSSADKENARSKLNSLSNLNESNRDDNSGGRNPTNDTIDVKVSGTDRKFRMGNSSDDFKGGDANQTDEFQKRDARLAEDDPVANSRKRRDVRDDILTIDVKNLDYSSTKNTNDNTRARGGEGSGGEQKLEYESQKSNLGPDSLGSPTETGMRRVVDESGMPSAAIFAPSLLTNTATASNEGSLSSTSSATLDEYYSIYSRTATNSVPYAEVKMLAKESVPVQIGNCNGAQDNLHPGSGKSDYFCFNF